MSRRTHAGRLRPLADRRAVLRAQRRRRACAEGAHVRDALAQRCDRCRVALA